MSYVLRHVFTQVTIYIKMENIHLSCAAIVCRSYSVWSVSLLPKFSISKCSAFMSSGVGGGGGELRIHALTYSQIWHRKKIITILLLLR